MPRTKSHTQRQVERKAKGRVAVPKRKLRSAAKIEKKYAKQRENTRARKIAKG